MYRVNRFGRLWILKGLNPDNRSTSALIELRKEFEIMMQLHHPGVADAYAYAIEYVEGIGDCIVMEYAGDVTLGQWLETHPDKSLRQRVAGRLLDAIGYIHSRGVVHRDIKPSNIIISDVDEQIKLIDFGLADTINHTLFKAPTGTKGFVDPDQEDISVPAVSSDIYSTGRVLELLDAGFSWNRVAKACVRKKNRRPHSIECLQRMQILPAS